MNQKQIKDKLLEFLSNNLPDDAGNFEKCCILSGPWGVGKTFVIDDISTSMKEYYRFVRVSLFGVGSQVELRTRIINEVCKFSSNAKKFLKTIFSSLSLDVNLGPFVVLGIDLSKITDALGQSEGKKIKEKGKRVVLVLDDIERKDNKLSMIEILGTIDELLKNAEIRVILIANLAKIKLNDECDSFIDFKEKVAKKTYELNDIKEITSEIIKSEGEFTFGKNLRTIFHFKEILDFISDKEYPHVVKDIIYRVLRIEKEKIDIKRFKIDEQKKNSIISGTTFDEEEAKRYVDSYPRSKLVIEYILKTLPLEYGDILYKETSIKKVIEYVHESIFEGDYDSLKDIPQPSYDVYIKPPKISPSEKEQKSKILKSLDLFQKAFLNNTIRFKESLLTYCFFLDKYYSPYLLDDDVKRAFEKCNAQLLMTITTKGIQEPQIFGEISDGFVEAIRRYSTNTQIKKLKDKAYNSVSKALTNLRFDSRENIFNSNGIVSSFLSFKETLGYNFFSEIDSDNIGICEGVKYIFSECKKNTESIEWDSYKEFFRNIPRMNKSIDVSRMVPESFDNDIEEEKISELVREAENYYF